MERSATNSAHLDRDAPPAGTLHPVPLRADDRPSWGAPGGGPIRSAGASDSALASYVRAIRSHVVVVIAVTVGVALAAVAWGELRTPTYKGTAQMLIPPLGGDDGVFIGMPFARDPGAPPRSLQTAATLIDSPRAAALAAQRLGKGWTARRVESAIEVSPEGQSSIIDITASSDSANDAAHVANVYAGAVIDSRKQQLAPLIDRAIASTRAQLSRLVRGSPSAQTLAQNVRQLEAVRDNDPTISISQTAPPPAGSAGIGPALLLFLGLVVGLALGTIAPGVLDLLRPR